MTEMDPEAPIRAACGAQDWSRAATLVVELYGRELLEFLVATARSEVDGAEAFSIFTEQLWTSLPKFRWAASARTWCYTLARRALARVRRDPHRKSDRAVAIDDAPVAAMVQKVRTDTLSYLRSAVKDRVVTLRDQLDPDDQALLILRIDRKLSWREVAMAFADEDDEPLDPAELGRRSAAMRKRFERIKDELRRLVGT
ncbi:MAG: RNA polymerase sigma factor [Kofleriaceae bacterium]